MAVWDITTPLGSDPANQGDDRIREAKAAIENALRGGEANGVVAVFPGSSPSTNPTYHYRGYRGGTGSRPSSGDYGLFIDTTRNVVQRDNGATWDDVATLIPAGTAMVFYQAAAPVGWTKQTTHNDKALRVVSGTGGGSGGADALSTYSNHVHATQSHVLTTAEMPSHSHGQGGYQGLVAKTGSNTPGSIDGVGDEIDTVSIGTIQNTGGGGGHDHGNTAGTTQIAYIDVIVCTKD